MATVCVKGLQKYSLSCTEIVDLCSQADRYQAVDSQFSRSSY